MHVDAFAPLISPVGQGSQAVCPAFVKVPAAHAVQESTPAAEISPIIL